jgi:hypothetical protein
MCVAVCILRVGYLWPEVWPYIVTFVAVAVFPLALAGVGGHLATIALADDPNRRLRTVLLVWALAITGVVFFGISQVMTYRADFKRVKTEELFRAGVNEKLQQIINEPNNSKQRSDALALQGIVARPASHIFPKPETVKPPDLKKETNDLANQIIAFTEGRNSEINQNSVIGESPERFKERIKDWNQDTNEEFAKRYWPQVMDLQSDLASAGIDISPISHAVKSDGPTKISLLLMAMANRIGLKPPYSRMLTPRQAKVIVETAPERGANVMVFFGKDDKNAKEIAEELAVAFRDDGWKASDPMPFPHGKEGGNPGLFIILPHEQMRAAFRGMNNSFWNSNIHSWVGVDSDIKQKDPYTIEIDVRESIPGDND